MSESVLKSLSKETKALVIVSEFEARRMPMFQMRAVLDEIVSNEEEKKLIVDLIENDLKATGYHPNQINGFLQDLLGNNVQAAQDTLRATRRLRSPFAQGFDDQAPVAVTGTPAPSKSTTITPPKLTSVTAGVPSRSLFNPPGARPIGTTIGGAASKFGGLTSPPPPAIPPPPPGSGVIPHTVETDAPGPRASSPVVHALPPPPGLPGFTPLPANIPPPSAIPPKPADTMFFGKGSAKAQLILEDNRIRVLLADDDKRIRIVFRLCLERLGLKVVEAEDGNDAWRKIQEGGLALAVLDMKMPGLHGLEVLTRMVDKHVDLPVIICSAYDNLREEFVVATYPKLRYLIKPVASESLERAVRDLITLPAPK